MKKSFSLNSLKYTALATLELLALPLVSCGGSGSNNKLNGALEVAEHNYDTIWEDGHYKVVEVIEEYYDDDSTEEWAEVEEAEESGESEDGINFDKVKGEDSSGATKTYKPKSSDYLSKDYQTYNLRGKVKKVTSVNRRPGYIEPNYYVENEFNKSGKETFGRWEPDMKVEVNRNANGYIDDIIAYDCIAIRDAFLYTDDNWVKAKTHSEESSTTQEFALYNKYGDPLETLLYGECYPDPELCGPAYAKYEYKYLERDDKGNWTKRVARFTDFYDKRTYTKEEEREIQYY